MAHYTPQDAERTLAWNLCSNATMVLQPQAYLAYAAVEHVDSHGILGDIVEAGVWLGGLSCLMAMAHRKRSRDLWLFDTFAGMPPPTAEDDSRSKHLFSLLGTSRFPYLRHQRDGKWSFGPLDDVKRTMARTGYAPGKVHYIVGKVEDTLCNMNCSVSGHSFRHGVPLDSMPRSIAILRLDTDWYTSTKLELDTLWPRLSPGGWLYVDDFGTFGGARRAVLEWLDRNGWTREATRVKAFPPHNADRFMLWKRAPYNSTNPFAEPLHSSWWQSAVVQ